MSNLVALFWLVTLFTSIWVIFDAKQIGIIKGQVQGFTDLGPWGWFWVCLLMWIIGFPAYLVKRGEYKRINALPEDQRPAVRPSEGFNLLHLMLVLLIGGVVIGIAAGAVNGYRQRAAEQTGTEINQTLDFDTKNLLISDNGNLKVAANKLASMTPDNLWGLADLEQVEVISKSPYTAIGKLYRIRGQVYKVQECPPDLGLDGKWFEVDMLARNSNSALDVSNVTFVYNGDATNINPDDKITCAGYYIGNIEGQNAMGGSVDGLVIVGNTFKHKGEPD